MHTPKDRHAVAMGRKRWANIPPKERRKIMEDLWIRSREKRAKEKAQRAENTS